MDLCARALLIAERMITDGRPGRELAARYADWNGATGQKLLASGTSLEDIAAHALQRNVDERPVSGRQEAWENLVISVSKKRLSAVTHLRAKPLITAGVSQQPAKRCSNIKWPYIGRGHVHSMSFCFSCKPLRNERAPSACR